MSKPDVPVSVPEAIAQAMIEGFNKHYRLFRETAGRAKERFELARWADVQLAVKERIRYYDERVAECVARLRREFNAESLDDADWQQAKLHYIGMLVNHKQPELAETFFNSVTTKTVSYTHLTLPTNREV